MTSKNYFVENNRTTSVMISKDRVNYEELLENTQIFFPSFVCSYANVDQDQCSWKHLGIISVK